MTLHTIKPKEDPFARMEPTALRRRLSRAGKMERIWQALDRGTPLAVIANRERLPVATLAYWVLEDFDFRNQVQDRLRSKSQLTSGGPRGMVQE